MRKILYVWVWTVLSFRLLDGYGADKNPWDPGVEKPCAEALASPLFIHPRSAVEKGAVLFTVTEQAGVSQRQAPVRGSIPFHRGELVDPTQIRLVNAKGEEVAVQGLITSYWPEKTARWLCVDFLTDIQASETQTFSLEFGTAVQGAKRSSLSVSEKEGRVEVNTGRMSVAFCPGLQFSGPVKRSEGGTTKEIQGMLIASKGESAPKSIPLHIDEVKIIEKGPVQTTIYLRGGYGEEKTTPPAKDIRQIVTYKFPFHGHVRIYGDTCRMEVIHSFGYNGDENVDFVQRYGLVLPVKTASKSPFIYGGELGNRAEAPIDKTLTLTQSRNDDWKLNGGTAKGKRFGGWGSLQNPKGFTTVALRNAWQQWPVTIEAQPTGELAMWIYGAPPGEFLDLRYEGELFGKSKSMYVGPNLSNTYYFQGEEGNGKARGILKISELVLDFESNPEELGKSVHIPLAVFAGSERISQTKSLGHIATYADAEVTGFGGLKNFGDAILGMPVIQHEANGLYGWVDWPDTGDTKAPKDGKFNMIMAGGIGWSNGCRGLLPYYFHYAAGGHERYLHLGHEYALHTIGIDMEHPGGDMNMAVRHRHNQVHWRDKGEPRQGDVKGWITDYWMTGHPEIHRILFEEYFPHEIDESFIPKAGNGPDKVWVYKKEGSLSYPHLFAYLTDNNPVWVKHHKGLDAAIYEIASQNRGMNDNDPYGEGIMTWQDGKIEVNIKKCPAKGPDKVICGYWLTYGGDDRLVDQISLFGYDISCKALKKWGETFWSTGKPFDQKNAWNYHNGESAYTGCFFLTKDKRPLTLMLKYLGQRQTQKKMFTWDSYNVQGTAEEWNKLLPPSSGHLDKNGFKITAALVYENIRALPLIKFAKEQNITAVLKDQDMSDEKDKSKEDE